MDVLPRYARFCHLPSDVRGAAAAALLIPGVAARVAQRDVDVHQIWLKMSTAM